MFLSAFSLLACTEIAEEPISISSADVSIQNSKYRTNEELANIALRAYSAIIGHEVDQTSSRGGSSITITPILPRLSRASSDTLIQVVNYGSGQGFALVGAQRGSEELLALIESGDYNPIESSQVEGFNDFIYRAELLLSAPAIGDTFPCMLNTKVERVYATTALNGPHIKTQWGQRDEFGYYCPNGLCGCGPLAVSMILSYFEQPKSMTFTFPEKDINSANFDWNLMNSHFKRHSDTWPSEWYGMILPEASECPASSFEHKNLGRLVRQIGYVVNADYKSGATSTYLSDLKNYIKNNVVGLSLTNYDTPDAQFQSDLENGVALTWGASSAGNHFWVIDGNMILGVIEKTYRDYAPDTLEGDWRLIKSELIELKDLLHHNWGWNGICNGYFLLGCYDINDATLLDPGASQASGYNFNLGTSFYMVKK